MVALPTVSRRLRAAQQRLTEETEQANPHWEYARKKAESERVLAAYAADADLPFTIVRPSHTYGATRIPGYVGNSRHPWTLVDRMRREFNVQAKVGKPRVSYRETITQPVMKVNYRYIKQSGGKMAVVAGPGKVTDMLKLTQIISIVTVRGTLAEAEIALGEA